MKDWRGDHEHYEQHEHDINKRSDVISESEDWVRPLLFVNATKVSYRGRRYGQ